MNVDLDTVLAWLDAPDTDLMDIAVVKHRAAALLPDAMPLATAVALCQDPGEIQQAISVLLSRLDALAAEVPGARPEPVIVIPADTAEPDRRRELGIA